MTQGVTEQLAEWIVGIDGKAIPAEVQREGLRTFVNWLGCAVGGASHETADRAIEGLAPFIGEPQAQVIGRKERLDALHTALLNGITSHVLDYDDTHLKTIIHPAGPVASALAALADWKAISGDDLLTALILGIEVECRIGNSIYPDHYDRGWHITSTTGVFGAAAAVGKIIGLDVRQMTWALGIAATQSSGLREMFGSMCKSFHPGRAAQNGMAAAFLAKANFDSSLKGIEAPRGFANVASTKFDPSEILEALGTRWEAALNSYKPYACGIVIHPAIDGCQQLRAKLGDRVKDIAAVDLRTHYLVPELTGKTAPKTGLEGKFSVFHAAAMALIEGDGSPTAFTDEAVLRPDVIALRDKVKVHSDPNIREDEVHITVTFEDGSRDELHVDHALGSLERPLSDAQIEEKFLKQASLVIGRDKSAALLDLAWKLKTLADAGEISRRSAA